MGSVDLARKRSITGFVVEKHPPVVGFLLIVFAWHVSTFFLNPVVAPPLSTIWEEIVTIVTDPAQFRNLVRTGARVVAALLVSFFFGTLLGLMLGLSNRMSTYLKPVLHIIQGIPALSWVVFAVIWFQNVEVRIAFILFTVTMPGFALYMDGAVRDVSEDLIALGNAFRASFRHRITKIILPATVPAILSSWSVNLGIGVRAVVVAELIGSTLGVGYQLLRAQSIFNMAGAIAWTVVLVVFLLILQLILGVVESRVLAWRPKHGGE